MTIRTLARFLIGDRGVIATLSADPRALKLGLLFTISAGLAREYDAEYLLAEPWHVLLPLAASLAAASILWAVLSICLRPGRHPEGPTAYALYPRFLTAFWLTAPLAWSYAVPWERLLSETDAAYANLWTLGLVAAWRVLLIMRVASVLYRVRTFAACWPVLLFCSAMALVAVSQMNVQIVVIMGGVRLNEAEQALHSLARGVAMLSCLTLPLSALQCLTLVLKPPELQLPPAPEPSPPTRGPWLLAGVAIAAGLIGLSLTQGQQARRFEVDRLVTAGEYRAAVDVLCAHPRDAFPPAWEPPPRELGDADTDALIGMTESLNSRREVPAWLLQAYGAKLRTALLGRSRSRWGGTVRLNGRFVRCLAGWPRPEDFRDRIPHLEALQQRFEGEERELLRALIEGR